MAADIRNCVLTALENVVDRKIFSGIIGSVARGEYPTRRARARLLPSPWLRGTWLGGSVWSGHRPFLPFGRPGAGVYPYYERGGAHLDTQFESLA